MLSSRLLLPFTHGIDAQAIEHAMRVASYEDATLVLISLISVPQAKKGPRLEHIEQSKDIVKFVKTVARWHQVAVELHEAYTSDPVMGIVRAYQHLACDSILVAMRGQQAVLIQTPELHQLIKCYASTTNIELVHLPPRVKFWDYVTSFSGRVRKTHAPQYSSDASLTM